MKQPFKRVFSGVQWEQKVGYCRAIKAGDHIFVSGTTAVAGDGSVYKPNDGYGQACRCFEIIERALKEFGGDLSNVVRTRMFVTDMSRWQEFGEAHQKYFGEYPPATTMVEVKSLINPAMLIEVEVDAVKTN